MGSLLTAGLRLIPLIVTAITSVEHLIGAKKGKEKQDAAVGLVAQFIPILESTISKDVVDDAKVQDAMRSVIDAAVKLMNVAADVAAKRAAQSATN